MPDDNRFIELFNAKLKVYEASKETATHAHRNHTRWDKSPYITHPARISNTFWNEDIKQQYIDLKATNTGECMALLTAGSVSYLHDVLEDCTDEYNLDKLSSKGITHDVLWPVVLLTKLPNETYHQYLYRLLASGSVIALSVKIVDIMDNCAGLVEYGDKKKDKIDKYMLALEMIKSSRLYQTRELILPGLKQKMENFLSVSADITKIGTY